MKRALGVLTLLTLGIVGESDALAEDAYMWGVGPKIGTIVVPGRYPLAWPTKINDYNFRDSGARAGDDNSDEPKRDLDGQGNQLFTSLERTQFDLQLAVDGFYGIDKDNRLGAGVGAGFGKRFYDYWFTINYDRVLLQEDQFNVVAGLQAGFGQMRWQGEDEDEALRVPYFPIRARLQGQLRDKVRMYAIGIWGQTSVPSSTYYTDLNGAEQAINSPFNFVLYLSAGIELQMMFGDFTPPRKKKKGKGKGGGGNKGGGGGGGGGGGNKGGGGGGKK